MLPRFVKRPLRYAPLPSPPKVKPVPPNPQDNAVWVEPVRPPPPPKKEKRDVLTALLVDGYGT